jgi:hypothetical protein
MVELTTFSGMITIGYNSNRNIHAFSPIFVITATSISNFRDSLGMCLSENYTIERMPQMTVQ